MVMDWEIPHGGIISCWLSKNLIVFFDVGCLGCIKLF